MAPSLQADVADLLACPACRAEDRSNRLTMREGTTVCGTCGYRARRTAGGVLMLVPEGTEASEYYESDDVLNEYLAFHFPDADPLRPFLGERTPPLNERHPFGLRELWEPRSGGLALDIGSACGRTTFDLGRDHERAIGIDRSTRLVEAAETIRKTGRVAYELIEEGNRRRPKEVSVDVPDGCTFLVADALACPFADERFDTICALNLLDRVRRPARAIQEMARLCSPGGLLIIGSPFTWLEAFTAPEDWLGGGTDENEAEYGAEAIRHLLGDRFERVRERTLPFFIPHHARSGQLGLTHIQAFRRQS